MPDLDLTDLLARAYESKSRDAHAIARKIENDWNNGVIPAPAAIRRLDKALAVVGPCGRLQDDGRCGGWLRKYGVTSGIVAREPYNCPFAAATHKESKFEDCPGFTTLK